MTDRRKNLEDSARLLRVRLQDLEHNKRNVPDIDRPAHEVATRAVKDELTNVGRQLQQLDNF